MDLFSSFLCKDKSAPCVPDDIQSLAQSYAREISKPLEAQTTFTELRPYLSKCHCNEAFVLDCALLVEKQRLLSGMLEFWSDLQALYPENPLTIRMTMRWFRRSRQIDEGIQRLYQLFPKHRSELDQASKVLLGLAELKAFTDMDEMMNALDVLNQDTRSLKMRYIKSLCEQSRFTKAKDVAIMIDGREKMGASSQALLAMVDRRAKTVERRSLDKQSDIITALVNAVGTDPRSLDLENGLASVVLFTGQLGTGGAERQLTRIASELQKSNLRVDPIGGVALRGPIEVCVRHATPASNSDFFLPVLRRAKVKTTILNDLPDMKISELDGLSSEICELLELLPEDILSSTLKLVPYFKSRACQVAYLWQDGGVLSAAIAALIAGVPRIVTSFRGMPPNLRPELSRPQLFPLYQSLMALDHVSFSANSQSTASLYEDWLEAPKGSIKVIRNATYMTAPDGMVEDEDWWQEIVSRSPEADRTILGVFRFDHNKRPLFWIDVAAKALQSRPNTRFVIVGGGYGFVDAGARIAELGLNDSIFLAGVREHVGFFYHKSDLVMHLARMEGLPNVLIEAQLSGKAVVATPAGGTDEVVTHGTTGHILEDAQDPPLDTVVSALLKSIEDPERLDNMGRAGKELAEPKFLVRSVLENTVSLFTQR